ncbi:MAG: mercury methylation corrinoid protein HgcA [Bacteroidetes bacterium]|nr:mercury methylation corrinoid protein HgcA [Bacteroidota bacterium]
MNADYITGSLATTAGTVPRISASLSFHDILNTIRVRWAIGRMNYKVEPGLYAVGNPDAGSEVFVTCNFKLTFDQVRKALAGTDAWLLILDTRGINVWCAAGKGTFGTKELVSRMGKVGLSKIVTHHRIILPQLGATGVSAHEVKAQTGFRVVYGPVRSEDISEFMKQAMKATQEMRTVNFPMWERMKLIPVELSYGSYYLLLVPALFIILSGLNRSGYSLDHAFTGGLRATFNLLVAYLAGLAVTPLLLPWIPFRRFALKGLIVGWVAALVLWMFQMTGSGWIEKSSWFLMTGGLTSFLAMNFTGSSTFTSLSGVQKEMKTALPLQIGMAALGIILWVISKFITV